MWAMLGAMLLSLPACEGIFDDVYDIPQAEEVKDFGFIEVDNANYSGTIYVDASDYTKWIYIDLHAQTVDSTRIADESGTEIPLGESGELPQNWDFAIHRYDAKTNDGAVLESGSTGFDVLISAGRMPEGNYVADEWTTDRITIDMSGMMQGNIKYAASDYNTVLSSWLNVDTSTMPPIYSMSNKVYVLRLKDGTYAALKLVDYRDSNMNKGFMKIEYIYPFERRIG